MRPAAGFTLIELVVALAVAGVLIGLAIPAMRTFVESQRSTAAINQLIGTVQFARSAALTASGTASLCPSANGVDCGARDAWHVGAIVFDDRNRNGRRDTDEAVLRGFPSLPEGSRAYWRSFRNRSYLSFTGSGVTAWQNGHFRYCPGSDDPRLIREIVINPQGRVRRAPDRNRDGIVEDTAGRPVTCPR
jgi:type IV fimbrial biogenesis protein FimT